MRLLRNLVTITSEALKEPHSFPLGMAQAVAAKATQLPLTLRTPPASTEQNQKLGGTSMYWNLSLTLTFQILEIV